ncbi:hypothetical protein FQN54_005491 [Arachnomyces sp. PD_36]|nr:hypothetical protein FQN54_005491 [Arachnomyces sp. PD_36]
METAPLHDPKPVYKAAESTLFVSLNGVYSHPWDLKNFRSLVSFGDSLTDRARFTYIANNNGTEPPVGWIEPDSNNTATGGYSWVHYVAESGVNLYNYAVGGAVCSDKITPVTLLDFLVPAFVEYEIPAYFADKKYTDPDSGEKIIDAPANETVYSIWIGTNDLANLGFLSDAQVEGKTISDSIECVYSALDELYAHGARYFVLMNIPPLQLAPLWATPERDGIQGENWAWPDKPANITRVSYRAWQEVDMVNYAYKYQTPYEMLIAERYPEARFALMDMNGLITHIYNNPSDYLDAPSNVTGYINHCNVDMSECHRLDNPDSFLWYDYSHPSQRTSQVLAENFLDVVKGESEWATYW